MNVETNVGRTFLNLIRKHFPPTHKFHKIFNKNSVKVSYSCMDNINKIIKSHNAKICKREEIQKPCNCQRGRTCPLDGNCQVANATYQAEVFKNEQEPPKVYIGLSEPYIKERIRNHQKAFNDVLRRYEKDSALSEYIWKLKDEGCFNYKIKWSILRRCPKYNRTSGLCSLCITEKLMISQFEDKSRLLNVRLDLATHCLHYKKHLLGNFKQGVG